MKGRVIASQPQINQPRFPHGCSRMICLMPGTGIWVKNRWFECEKANISLLPIQPTYRPRLFHLTVRRTQLHPDPIPSPLPHIHPRHNHQRRQVLSAGQ
jgi:hypothetical protein